RNPRYQTESRSLASKNATAGSARRWNAWAIGAGGGFGRGGRGRGESAQRFDAPQINGVVALLRIDRDLLVGRDVAHAVADGEDPRAVRQLLQLRQQPHVQ